MPTDIDRQYIENLFPTLADMTYLNNAGTGIPPTTTVDAMKQHLVNRTNAKGKFADTLKMLKEVRTLLAKLLGGDYSQYGLVPNTSSGINALAHSIKYPKGSNVVLCDLEFPANYVPWQNISRLYDVDLRVVKSKQGAAPVDAFREMIDENTRVVAISQIQFGSGYRADLESLAASVHEVGGFLAADIIQAAGYIDTDLAKIGVDFAAGQAAKWLLGPIGAGYIYLKESLFDTVRPKFLGWWGVKDIMNFSYSMREHIPDARMFQVGSPPVITYVGMVESLKVIHGIPAKTRERTALDNAEYLRKRLEENGVEYYDFGSKHNSAIVSCAPPDAEKLLEKLSENRIHCSVRNGRLRVAPHFYNSRTDIDKLMEHLG